MHIGEIKLLSAVARTKYREHVRGTGRAETAVVQVCQQHIAFKNRKSVA